MPTARLSDVTLHYQIDGDAVAPPLLLSNSLGTSLEMWEPQMATLAGRFRVIRYDSRGHGQSTVTAGPTRSSRSPTTRSACSMRSRSRARTFAGCRWAAWSACGSAFMRRSESTGWCSPTPRRRSALADAVERTDRRGAQGRHDVDRLCRPAPAGSRPQLLERPRRSSPGCARRSKACRRMAMPRRARPSATWTSATSSAAFAHRRSSSPAPTDFATPAAEGRFVAEQIPQARYRRAAGGASVQRRGGARIHAGADAVSHRPHRIANDTKTSDTRTVSPYVRRYWGMPMSSARSQKRNDFNSEFRR